MGSLLIAVIYLIFSALNIVFIEWAYKKCKK